MEGKHRANFLDYVPSRRVECSKEAGDRLVLLVPKFGTGRLGRWWSSVIGRRSTLKIHLDEMGSRTWVAIDGRRTVGQIAQIVGRQDGDPGDGMYERCSRFIRTLSNAGAIHLDPPVDP